MNRSCLLPTIALVATVGSTAVNTSCVDARASGGEEPGDRPNVLLIISDDQRYDTMEYMPETQSRIFEEGATFSNAYVTTPLCGASRASILTGQYMQNHCVYTNRTPLLGETFIEHLHESGYLTGIVGKYLNSYPLSYGDGPLTEFDYWVAHGGFGGTGDYFEPELNVNGTWTKHSKYFTYLERDYALEFLDLAAETDQPFALIFSPYAPHFPADPAPGDETLYSGLDLHRPPSFNEEDMSDKPTWLNSSPPLTTEEIESVDTFRKKQLQSMHALDSSIGTILDRLEEMGELDNTLIVFTSDNGMFWGEHRLFLEKYYVYEEAIHVPMAVRYPPLIPEPLVEDSLVANIDIAPTIYELTNVSVPQKMDGQSLVPLLNGEVSGKEWRGHIYIETVYLLEYFGIRTERYLYAETQHDRAELYDLESDPYQLENQIDNSEYKDVIETLSTELRYARPARPLRYSNPRCWFLLRQEKIMFQAKRAGLIVLLTGLALAIVVFVVKHRRGVT
jgi:N-acetylglucosamine-6-sulfatase